MPIIVNPAELLSKIQEIVDDGMDFVEINYLEADDDAPACLWFEAWKRNDDCSIAYEEVEAVDESAE